MEAFLITGRVIDRLGGTGDFPDRHDCLPGAYGDVHVKCPGGGGPGLPACSGAPELRRTPIRPGRVADLLHDEADVDRDHDQPRRREEDQNAEELEEKGLHDDGFGRDGRRVTILP